MSRIHLHLLAAAAAAFAALALPAPAGARADDKAEDTFTSDEAPKFSLKRPGKGWSFVDVAAERRDTLARIDEELKKLEGEKKTLAEEPDGDDKKKKQEELKKEEERLKKLKADTESSTLRCRLVRRGEGKLEAIGGLDGKPADFVRTAGERLEWDLEVTERVGFRFRTTAASLRFRCLIEGGAHLEHIYVGAKGAHPEDGIFVLENPKKDPGGARTPYGRPDALGPGLAAFYGIWKEDDGWTVWLYRAGEKPARFEGSVEIPETAGAEVHTAALADPSMGLDKVRAQIEADVKKRDPAARLEPSEPFKAAGAEGLRFAYHLKGRSSRVETHQVLLFKRDGKVVELQVIAPQESLKKESALKRDAAAIVKALKIAWDARP